MPEPADSRPAPASRCVRIFAGRAELAAAAAGEVARTLAAALAARPTASLVLAGGSTPEELYRRLAEGARASCAADLAWERVHLFWGDERAVPPDDPASNYRLARETLLAGRPGRARVHRILGELPPAEAAERYEREIAAALGARPRFDLVLLGVGADGHTASLFPGGEELEASGLATASRGPWPPRDRVSLTLGALSAARKVVFLVAGGERAAAVARVLGGAAEHAPPAARIRAADGETLWLLDRAAAASLEARAEGSGAGHGEGRE